MSVWDSDEEHLRAHMEFRRASEWYTDGRWFVQKIRGGRGHKIRRVLPGLWRWWAWPHENVGSPDYFVRKGWATAGYRAHEAARRSYG